jgi:nucleotide-binding universal stress UspA family protein
MSRSEDSRANGVVVVGVDGSAGSQAALSWAADEARLRRTRLRAVHAWTFPYPAAGGADFVWGYPYLGGSIDAVLGSDLDDHYRAAVELLARLIADAAVERDDLEIERRAVEGPAASVLVHAVAANDLLVVGSRGHGGIAGLLLGSVSQQCAHHAPCPVVIVHAEPSAGDARKAAGRAGDAMSRS